MTMSRWEPFKDFLTLRQAMDRLFEDSIVRPARLWESAQGGGVCSVDAYMTKDAIVIQAAVPGADPDDVEITVEGNTVKITGEVKPPEDERTYLLQEQHFGPFSRSLELGIPVQADKAEASFKNGMLTLTIPKAEDAKPKVIKVKAS